MGDGEGDEGGVSEGLQDEGLQIGQLGSVGEPGPPRPANHSVCRARRTEKAEGVSPAAWHLRLHLYQASPYVVLCQFTGLRPSDPSVSSRQGWAEPHAQGLIDT